ncbi:hypothetical protein D3C78_1298600 [compost metagenome]
MPPSLLSAHFANGSLFTEWPAFHTRVPSPWPSPQGEGTGWWISHSSLLSQQGKGNLCVDAGNMLEIFAP